MRIWHALMAWLFPSKCVLCGELLKKNETDLCKACREGAPVYPNGREKPQFLDSFAAVWYYEGCIRKSLLRYKFYGKRSYGCAYGRALAMVIEKQWPEGFEILTWVPISPLRKFRRGYDQTRLLAQAVGRELGIVPVPVLQKVRHNPPQSRIRGSEKRRANVLGAYRVLSPETLAGKRVLLIDDILTTGATAGECARMLKTAGAKEVYCAAVAAARK